MIFFLLCVSPFGAGMPNPGERLGFNLICKKCSPQNYKQGRGQKSGRWVLSKIPPPQISLVFPRFSPVFPPFFLRFPVFPRFSPFSPVFPRFSQFFPATGNQTPIGYGNLKPLDMAPNLVARIPNMPYLMCKHSSAICGHYLGIAVCILTSLDDEMAKSCLKMGRF